MAEQNTAEDLAKRGLILGGLESSLRSNLSFVDSVTIKIPENALLIRGKNSPSFFPDSAVKAIREYFTSIGYDVNVEINLPDLKEFSDIVPNVTDYVFTFKKKEWCV